MSHAVGIVFSKENEILYYYEYNGTVDLIEPKLYDTLDELMKNWRRDDVLASCKDTTHTKIPVFIHSSYGWDEYWDGLICKECKIIISPLMNVEEDDWPNKTKGRPDKKGDQNESNI